MSTEKSSPSNTPSTERSMIGTLTWAAGFLFILFSLFSVLNTAFGWHIEVKGTPLPDSWDATIGLIAVSILWWGIWCLLTLVKPIQRWGRRHPWIMALIVLGAITLAIVIITVIDNANIEARHKSYQYKARQDSLRRLDSIKHFEAHPVN